MITNFQIIAPDPLLKNYIERIFLIESSGRMPSDDLKLIVPNACAKLVIPFKNGLSAHSAALKHVSRQHQATFIGISDISAMVDYTEDGPAGNITIEFSPLGLYRFFNFSLTDVKNQIFDFDAISKDVACRLQEQLVNTDNKEEKIRLVQKFLLQQFSNTSPDPVFDFCVQQILNSKGTVSIRQLEKYTGYSARWLNMKFREKTGISPKNLASIIRFQQYYKSLVTNTEQFFLKKEFYSYYHDQSHFTRDFKRFTGFPPLFLSQKSNHYDSVFYRD